MDELVEQLKSTQKDLDELKSLVEIKSLQVNSLQNKIQELKQLYLEHPNIDLFIKYYKPNLKLEDGNKLEKLANKKTKMGFILYCLDNIEYITKLYQKSYLESQNIKSSDNSDKLRVIYLATKIEPHLEFIIKNNIIKLNQANHTNFHTLICSSESYTYFKSLSDTIKELTVINQPGLNSSKDSINQLFLIRQFWEGFEEENLLLSYDNSIIFNANNLRDFFKFDYIGGAWLKPKFPNQLFQGNGGFSFRKKSSIIQVFNLLPPEKMPNILKPLALMKKENLKVCFEDVYFSQVFKKFKKNFTLPTFDDCCNFSLDNFNSNNPVGGHDFFKFNWEKLLKYEFKNDLPTTQLEPVEINTKNQASHNLNISYHPNRRILFVYFTKNEEIFQSNSLYQAVLLLYHKYKITFFNLSKKGNQQILKEINRHDVILYMSAINAFVDKKMRELKPFHQKKLAIILGGGHDNNFEEELKIYHAFFYEYQYSQTNFIHPNKYPAFGIYIPPEINNWLVPFKKRKYDWISTGIFKRYKNHHLIIKEKGNNKIVLGYYKKNGEAKRIIERLENNKVEVREFTTYQDYLKLLCQTKNVLIGAKGDGGGERAILEARLCQCKIKVIDQDNPKFKEVLAMPLKSHIDYSYQILTGLDSLF